MLCPRKTIHNSALPLLYLTSHHITPPLLCQTVLRFTFAKQHLTVRHPCITAPYITIPLPCLTIPCVTFAVPDKTVHHFTFAVPCRTTHYLCVAGQNRTLPLLYPTVPYTALLHNTKQCHTLPLHHKSTPCFTSAQQCQTAPNLYLTEHRFTFALLDCTVLYLCIT